MLKRLRTRVARWVAPTEPKKSATRQYAAARATRLNPGWQSMSSSEDREAHESLRQIRDRSRALCRDAPYAKRARTVVTNNVVGTGIGLQAKVMSTRGGNYERLNASIEQAWADWSKADSCHTGGALHFCEFERALMDQVFEAGEVFVRLHFDRFGRSAVPLSLELIEPERLADNYQTPPPVAQGANYRLGVEQDGYGRPLAYWLRERHPYEVAAGLGERDRIVRVPAEQMLHLRVIHRWPQTRGVPWMHAAILKLQDVNGYTEAEIVAARAAANYMGFITTDADNAELGESQADGTTQVEMTPGVIEKLAPGETFDLASPNRPNSQAEAFIRLLTREIAAGIDVSYESLSRDYSQSNYSSSRLALLDDRDIWRVLQGWFIRSFREPLHRIWLQQAALAGAIEALPRSEYALNPAKFEAARFRPRGWGWVDPTKEVEAYKQAVLSGFTTVADVVAATSGGLDLEDVLQARRLELDQMAALDLTFDSEFQEPPEPVAAPAPTPAAEPAEDDDEDEDEDRRLAGQVAALRAEVAGASARRVFHVRRDAAGLIVEVTESAAKEVKAGHVKRDGSGNIIEFARG